MQVSAVCKFIPSPPARVDKIKTNFSVPARQVVVNYWKNFSKTTRGVKKLFRLQQKNTITFSVIFVNGTFSCMVVSIAINSAILVFSHEHKVFKNI